MNTTTTVAPKRSLGFWITGLFALVWNLIGVAMWYLQVNLSAEQLYQLVLGVSGDLTAEQQNFVRVLVENERLQVLPEIRDLFVALKNEHEGVMEAHIASAFPLDDAALAALKADLEARFKAAINVTVTLAPELIGGVRIAVGDEVIDASVRGKLANMAAALKN